MNEKDLNFVVASVVRRNETDSLITLPRITISLTAYKTHKTKQIFTGAVSTISLESFETATDVGSDNVTTLGVWITVVLFLIGAFVDV